MVRARTSSPDPQGAALEEVREPVGPKRSEGRGLACSGAPPQSEGQKAKKFDQFTGEGDDDDDAAAASSAPGASAYLLLGRAPPLSVRRLAGHHRL
jgi:hypothetical protein